MVTNCALKHCWTVETILDSAKSIRVVLHVVGVREGKRLARTPRTSPQHPQRVTHSSPPHRSRKAWGSIPSAKPRPAD